MKIRIWILFVIVYGLAACGGDTQSDSGYFSDFTIENNSNYKIEVEYEVPSSNETDINSFFLAPGVSETFFSQFSLASSISSAPSPESTFIQFEIYLIEEEQRTTSAGVLVDSLWEKNIVDQLTIYSLSVMDSDFVF